MPKQNRINFTKAEIEGLPLPEDGKRVWYWDTKTNGLALRISSKGNRRFYVYRWVSGKPQQISIGSYPDVTIEQARRKAAELNGAAAQGVDLKKAAKSTRGEMTFGKLFEWYFENHSVHKKSQRDDEMQFRLHFQGMVNTRLSKITKSDLRALHQEIANKVRKVDEESGTVLRSGHHAANKALRLMRAVFNAAISDDLFKGENPALHIKWFKEESRERRLMPSEIQNFLIAVQNEENEAIRDFVRLSLLTGARRSNVLSMRWDNINLEDRIWRIPETKNGKPQEIPLEDQEVVILRQRKQDSTSEWVFPGEGRTGHLQEPKKGWARILKRAGITDLRIHDLRRSLGSFMADAGASQLMIGKALNHLDPTSTEIYARLSQDALRGYKRKAHALIGTVVIPESTPAKAERSHNAKAIASSIARVRKRKSLRN